MELYVKLARTLDAYLNCVESHNVTFMEKHLDTVASLVKEHMPYGCGFDSPIELRINDYATSKILAFYGSFHKMDNNGYYPSWVDYAVRVKADLAHGFSLKVAGVFALDLKDYISNVFNDALRKDVP